MILLSALDFSLPLKNPVIIFSLVLFIILFAPILFNRIKVPHIIGLIISGIIIGPYGFNLLLRDNSIVLFGTVGLLYIMFTAGLEIEMEEFKKTKFQSLVFGLVTFLLPMILGTLAAVYLLNFDMMQGILLGGMLSTHTLLAYPIVSKYGIAGIRAVTLTIGGTIVTDVLSLLALAFVTGMTKGDIGPEFWLRIVVGSILLGAIIFYVFPLIASWFFKKFADHISQYIFVLAMVFLGSFLAEVAGLEAIIGAFLSGLALNRFIPHVSALMNRIDFVGNAFFIPFFLISVGMLVDVSVLFNGWGAVRVAAVMIIVAVLSKYLAALFTQKTFRLSSDDRRLIFGLSTARVGATLAIVLVGYNIIIAETAAGEPIRLLSEDVLNGTILMILVTCTISSFAVEKAAQIIAHKNDNGQVHKESKEKILISLAYPETVVELVDLGLMLKPRKSDIPVYALHVTDDQQANGATPPQGKKIIEKAVKHAAATEDILFPITRHDINISHGIIYSIKEHEITDIIIGLHINSHDDFFGPTAQAIFTRITDTIYMYKPIQPFNTLKRMVVAVPPKAELEPGFRHWLSKLTNLAKEAGMSVTFYASRSTIRELEVQTNGSSVKITFNEFNNWDDFLMFKGELQTNDFFIVITSREGNISYGEYLEKLPYYMKTYFQNNSFIILYPKQLEQGFNMANIQQGDHSLLETLSGNTMSKVGSSLKSIFKKRTS
ncbi:cation:proton antiporter [Daejeonella lutea]|uniref:Kef-type K+ transport system, membrane component KefB n=1 Tax=Daejeonella lutea TaxID=572036 RepID=A0A1T5ANC9_9SPHI|nr:cation:proton antiporter [Daejeonella lutea]SKB36488.1 Kef-type K+ transport system, membrane component KefB [Daejeonella lutea]